MRRALVPILLLFAVAGIAGEARLVQVADLGDQQATGVAVCVTGRVFLTFPRWSERVPVSVAELMPDGTLKPYPDRAWNEWRPGSAPESHFVCAQSALAHSGSLWLLDPASPNMAGAIAGGPKLVQIDLSTDRLQRVIRFDESVAPPSSYLNDVRVAPAAQRAYLTDSGAGALVVVDLASGASRRLLEQHPSTQADPERALTVEGRPVTQDGRAPRVHSDGIALSPDGAWLYWHALTGDALWRAPTRLLGDLAADEATIAAAVERVADTGAHDGLEFGPDGRLYATMFERSAISAIDPSRPQDAPVEVLRDPRLSWPDSIAVHPDGSLYVTASQIQRMPRFNEGVDRREDSYRLWRIELPR